MNIGRQVLHEGNSNNKETNNNYLNILNFFSNSKYSSPRKCSQGGWGLLEDKEEEEEGVRLYEV